MNRLKVTRKLLMEATRSQLITKSKKGDSYASSNQHKGKNRWERRKYSQIATQVKDFNSIDLNALFKGDMLEFTIPVHGETNNYKVVILFEKILEEIREQVKRNNNKLEYKCILRALLRVFNSDNVYVSCDCPDFTYTFAYYSTRNRYNSGTPQASNGKGIRNPNDTKGAACKHVNLCLANLNWMMKIASVINNYIWYCKDNMENNYAQYIFPVIYGMPYDKAIQLTFDNFDAQGNLIDDPDLATDEATINLANALGKRRTQYKKAPQQSVNPRYVPPKKEKPISNELGLNLDDEETDDEETNESLIEKIVKVGDKWQVQSEQGRNMGTYDTEEEAEKRLKQIEYFKHKRLDEYYISDSFQPYTAGYILENGDLVVMDEYHGEEEEYRNLGLPEYSNTHSEEDTCVRIYNKPNNLQYKRLEEIIDYYLDNEDYCKVEIWKNNKHIFYKVYSLHEDACQDPYWEEEIGNWTGYKLVRIIQNYFNNSENLNESEEDYIQKFRTRTQQHIDRVNKYAKKIGKEYPHHDEDKFNELFDGYSLMSKDNVDDEEQALIDKATFEHVKNQEHHCEHWCNPEDIEGFSRKNPTPHGCLDCSKMPEHALEEMCCDWCAMSEEFGNTPFEWYKKNKDTRWHFNEEQDKFITELLHKLWDDDLNEDFQDTLKSKGFKFNKYPAKGASYIMPDGSFLNLKDNEAIIGSINGKVTHPDLDFWLVDNNIIPVEGDANRALIKSDNAIRLNDGTNFSDEAATISLPPKPLSQAQIEQLSNWLADVCYMLDVERIDVGDETTIGFKSFSIDDNIEDDIQNILSFIKAKYK